MVLYPDGRAHGADVLVSAVSKVLKSLWLLSVMSSGVMAVGGVVMSTLQSSRSAIRDEGRLDSLVKADVPALTNATTFTDFCKLFRAWQTVMISRNDEEGWRVASSGLSSRVEYNRSLVLATG